MASNPKSSDVNNLFIALIISTLVLVYWQHFIAAPHRKAESVALRPQMEEARTAHTPDAAAPAQSVGEILRNSPRLPIDSPFLHGSLALKGLRIDDLTLTHYRETLAPDSPPVTLLSPSGTENSYFAEFGWLPEKDVTTPDAQTLWSAEGGPLSRDHAVTLRWTNPQGTVFRVDLALDEQYLFTVAQSVRDAHGAPVKLRSYAYINRVYDPKQAAGLSHEGPLGVFDGILHEVDLKKLAQDKEEALGGQSGWVGMSDKYWLSALIPQRLLAPQEIKNGEAENGRTENQPAFDGPLFDGPLFDGKFELYNSGGREHLQIDYVGAPTSASTLYFFAGAKVLSTLDDYSARYHIPLFDRAVDFGYLYFLTKPIFLILTWFHALVGNFGVAILLLTVLVKALMFPLASKSFRAMNEMKRLQPKMKELSETYKDDKLKLNQAIMQLYKKEGVNPASGCLPLIIQIPVFFALYKVLFVTIEMRHTPFFGWVHDLSAPDPTNLFTLFGFAAWPHPAWLHLGAWPLVMCVTMLIQQRQSPPPADPAQARMMKLMPFMLLFLFVNAPAGLVIYWSWSNFLTIVQQWYIKRRYRAREA